MRKLSVTGKQFIHRYRNRKKCIFEENITIDSFDWFEGGDRLAAGVTLLTSRIGYGSSISSHSFIKNTLIGKYTCIATDVLTMVSDHPSKKFVSIHPAFYSMWKQSSFSYLDHEKHSDFKFLDAERKIMVEIRNDVWIGLSVKIMEGVHINDGAVVAVGVIVTKDVPPYTIVGGVPAKVIRYRFNKEQIDMLMKIKWWNKGEIWIKDNADKFEGIATFINEIINEIIPDSIGEGYSLTVKYIWHHSGPTERRLAA